MRIEENEVSPHINIKLSDDMWGCDDRLLYDAINGLKSMEGLPITEANRARIRTYLSMIEKSGYEYDNNSTIADIRTTWYLEDVLKYYKKYYPERYDKKEEYTRMDVNNMLFDLSLKNVLRGHSSVALPYSIAEDYNNKRFSEYEGIEVQLIR